MPSTTAGRRIIYVLACVLPVWAVVAYFTGGVGWMIGPIRLSSRQPLRPLLIGLALAAWYGWRFSRPERASDGEWMMRALERAAPVAVPAIMLLAFDVGIRYGTYAAAGSDSYGYVSQAELWREGTLRVAQPWVQQFSWPNREWVFAPLGYRPLSADGTIVPTYPAGLPIVMAVFLAVFGSNGPFFVVPVFGTAAVWLTSALGREASGSRRVGIIAALLLLASPVFLANIIAPMSDIPAAAGWALVALLVIRGDGVKYSTTAGWMAGLTLLIRPNLFLMTLLPLAVWQPLVKKQDAFIRYALGVAPGVFAIMLLNVYLYGGPLTFGYGTLFESYSVGALPANVRNYASWLVETQTPLVTLAVLPFVVRGAFREEPGGNRARRCIAAMLALCFASYVFYGPFDLWFYLRFLLPMYPAMFVLIAIAIAWLCLKLPEETRVPAAVLVCMISIGFGVRLAANAGVFTSADGERRHIRAANALAQRAPENAVVFSVQHSGSIRYYARRATLRYDWLTDDGLDRAIADLAAKGYPSYLVVDDWEDKEFRGRFSPHNRAGKLDQEPIARVPGQPEVRIYELR